jgi:hypothetical protein
MPAESCIPIIPSANLEKSLLCGLMVSDSRGVQKSAKTTR